MKNAAALIIAQDCAPDALTLRGYNMLLAVDSPYVLIEKAERHPAPTDVLFARHILMGDVAAALAPGFLQQIAEEAAALSPEQIAQIDEAVNASLEPAELALLGMASGDKGAPLSNGITVATLLRCAKEFGWTFRDTLDSPLATLLLTLREDQVQAGKSISFGQIDTINQMKAAAAAAAEAGKDPANGG